MSPDILTLFQETGGVLLKQEPASPAQLHSAQTRFTLMACDVYESQRATGWIRPRGTKTLGSTGSFQAHSLCCILSVGCNSQLCLPDTGAIVAGGTPSCCSVSGYMTCLQVLSTGACADTFRLDMGCFLSLFIVLFCPHLSNVTCCCTWQAQCKSYIMFTVTSSSACGL